MSANEVLEALLDAMPDSYQKTIGFPTYDLLAAASLRLAETDAVIEDARAACSSRRRKPSPSTARARCR